MPRKTTVSPAIFDRVHYSNPQIIADWKKKFSTQTPRTEQAVGKTTTKAPRQEKPIEKPARKAPLKRQRRSPKTGIGQVASKSPQLFSLTTVEIPWTLNA